MNLGVGLVNLPLSLKEHILEIVVLFVELVY